MKCVSCVWVNKQLITFRCISGSCLKGWQLQSKLVGATWSETSTWRNRREKTIYLFILIKILKGSTLSKSSIYILMSLFEDQIQIILAYIKSQWPLAENKRLLKTNYNSVYVGWFSVLWNWWKQNILKLNLKSWVIRITKGIDENWDIFYKFVNTIFSNLLFRRFRIKKYFFRK